MTASTSRPTQVPTRSAADVQGIERPAGGTGRPPIRVALVEDHHLVREGIRLVLSAEPGIAVVGECGEAAEAFDLIERTQPAVALIDVTLPDGDGIPLLRSLRTRFPGLRIITLTMHRDAETVRQAVLAGAAGYVVKGAHSSELVAAIRAVARGERYLHSSVTSVILDDSLRWMLAGTPLSAREREILSLLAAGYTAPVIAQRLGISAHTVRRHAANLGAKLNLRGRSALIRYATEHGLARERGD